MINIKAAPSFVKRRIKIDTEKQTATFTAAVQRSRRVVIPASVARELNIERGDKVIVTIRKVKPRIKMFSEEQHWG